MKNLTISAVILLLLICPGTVFAEKWDIGRTIKSSLDNSAKSKIESLNKESAELDKMNAKMGWYPTVSFTATGKYVNKVMGIDMPGRTITFGDNDSYDFKLQMNQLVYDSGRLNSYKDSARHRALSDEYRKEAMDLAVEYQAKAAFYSVLMYEKSVEAAGMAVSEAENHLRDVKARYSQGMALETNVLMSELRVSQSKMDMITRQSDLDKASALFRKVTGTDNADSVEIVFTDNPIGDLKEYYLKLSENRPEIKAYSEMIFSLEKNAEAAKAEALPTVGLFGAFNYGQPGLDLPKNEWMHYFSAGVSLNWNVWDWGQSKRSADKYNLSKKIVEQEKRDFSQTLDQNLKEAIAELEKSDKRAKLSEEVFGYSESNLKLTASLYREGMASETDYDNAHSAYSRAAMDRSVSSAVLQMAYAQLEYVLGIRYNGGKNE